MPTALSSCAPCANASLYLASPYVLVPVFPPYALFGRNLHPLPVSLCHQHSRHLPGSMLSETARFDDLSNLDLLCVSLNACLSILQDRLPMQDLNMAEVLQVM